MRFFILLHIDAISSLLLKHCSAGAANVHVLTKALRIVTAAVFHRALYSLTLLMYAKETMSAGKNIEKDYQRIKADENTDSNFCK